MLLTIPEKIDLHIHTTVSDGTDTPRELLKKIESSPLGVFAVTDHDAISACADIAKRLTSESPAFICGVEFSCQDDLGKYHILGYGYDPELPAVKNVVSHGHMLRLEKTMKRLDFLKEEFGFEFTEEEIMALLKNDNPGKPHIANMMVKKGYALTKEDAIENYLNKRHFKNEHLLPEEAIKAVLEGGGIPVLAHPSFGSGEELIVGLEMEERLKRLIGFGLQGIEAYYSKFDRDLHEENIALAKKYGLYITAGSDYHGKNKNIPLGQTGLDNARTAEEGLKRFLNDVRIVGF